jgi:GH24 family phage-related lysozyme (muramidase)
MAVLSKPYNSVPDEILTYIHANGKVDVGLVSRRQFERALIMASRYEAENNGH